MHQNGYLTILQASVQQMPHILCDLYFSSTSFLNISDIPEWYHTTQSWLLCGKRDCRNIAVCIVSRWELQYTKNGKIFSSIQAWLSAFTSSGSRKARSKQLWSVNFMGQTQRWMLGLSFDLQLTSVLPGNPEIFSMSLRTLWWRVAEVKKKGTVSPSMEKICPICTYADLKSRPHWLIQCASSKQIQSTFFWNWGSSQISMKCGSMISSGDMTTVQNAFNRTSWVSLYEHWLET